MAPFVTRLRYGIILAGALVTALVAPGCKRAEDLPPGPAEGAPAASGPAAAPAKRFKVALSSRPGQWNLEERIRGYRETFANEYPEIEVVKEIDDETKIEVGTKEAAAVLEQFQDLAGFAGVNGASGPGIAQAVQDLGRGDKVIVVAMDGDSPILDRVASGAIYASVAQRQYFMGYLGVKYLYGLRHKLLRDPDDPQADSGLPAIEKEVDTGTVEVTKANVDVFRTPSQGAKEELRTKHPDWVKLLEGQRAPGDTASEEYVALGISTGGEYWQAAAGLNDAGKELGVKTRFSGPEDHSPEKQAEELDSAIARKPAGILIAPGNPGILTPYIDRAIEHGIPVICFDTDAPESKRIAYIGTSNYEAGCMGAHILAKALGAERKVPAGKATPARH